MINCKAFESHAKGAEPAYRKTLSILALDVARAAMCGLLFCAPAVSQVATQPALSITPLSAPLIPGQSTSLTVNLTGSAGKNLMALFFRLDGPVGMTFDPAGSVVATTNTTGYNAVCLNPINAGTPPPTVPQNPNAIVCTIVGFTDASGTLASQPLQDGAVAVLPIQFASGTPGTATITMSETDGTAPTSPTDAQDVPVTGANLAVQIGTSPCDVNGDGVVNKADAEAAIAALDKQTPWTPLYVLSLTNVYRVIEAVGTGTCSVR